MAVQRHARLSAYVESSGALHRISKRGAALLHISDESTFRKRHNAIARHDEVIECPDIDQRQRLFECLRQQFVGARRLGDA